jgi:hypothetical protein
MAGRSRVGSRGPNPARSTDRSGVTGSCLQSSEGFACTHFEVHAACHPDALDRSEERHEAEEVQREPAKPRLPVNRFGLRGINDLLIPEVEALAEQYQADENRNHGQSCPTIANATICLGVHGSSCPIRATMPYVRMTDGRRERALRSAPEETMILSISVPLNYIQTVNVLLR